MKKKLNITVLVDIAEIPPEDPEFFGKNGHRSTEHNVIGALRNLGHRVSILGSTENIEDTIVQLREQEPDLIFNLTEHLGGNRKFDKNIAALLEIFGIPFTGANSTGLLLSRDKRLCKQLLSLHRIRVPKFISLSPKKVIKLPKNLDFPLVVKPALEDSSEGISNASVVWKEETLKERVKFVHEKWKQAVIAEQYIEGRELYVSILGNKKLYVLPIRECSFNTEDNKGPCLATYRVKWNEEYRDKWNIKYGFAKLEVPLIKKIERVCKKVYKVLNLRDYGRIDIRITPNNKIYILEANSNPDLAHGEDVAESAEQCGISYESLIKRIVNTASKRYNTKRSFAGILSDESEPEPVQSTF
ncbi:MAG: ATP-grasp domain-containing protein [Sedimentisphaerales bacterium]|nr:ATP-grasp domain-containing protein [Sedimentisphaerales bacterium]